MRELWEETPCPNCGGLGYCEEPNPLPGYSPGPAPYDCGMCNETGVVRRRVRIDYEAAAGIVMEREYPSSLRNLDQALAVVKDAVDAALVTEEGT